MTDTALPRSLARLRNWGIGILVTLVALVAAIWLVLFLTKGRFLRPYFEKFASSSLGRPVGVTGEFNLYFAPIDIAFRADGLTIANADWAGAKPFLHADHLGLSLETLPLLTGKRRISTMQADGFQVAAQWDKAHRRNNWTFGSGPPKPLTIPDIIQASLRNSSITYDDPLLQLNAQIAIKPLYAANSVLQGGLMFDGTGRLRGRPIRFSGNIAQADRALLRGGSSRVTLHGEGARTRIDLTGTMPGITSFDDGRYHLEAHGRNMADLFNLIGVAVVETRPYVVEADVSRPSADWTFERIRGRFGDSDLAGLLRVGLRGERLYLKADLQTRALNLLDAAPFLGYDPERLDRLGTKGLVTQENGHPRILPDAPLRSDAINRFDADVRYRVTRIVAQDFPVGDIDATLHLDHGLMRLDPVTAVVATGKFDAKVTLDARAPQVITDYAMHLSPTPMGKLLYRFGVEESGTTGTLGARLAMRGVGNSLRDSLAHADGRMAFIIPAGTMWARNIQLAELDLGTFLQKMFAKKLKEPVQIRCGLLGFTVKDGISSADPILIDTKKNVITGRGQFSFRDESINMGLRADAKTFSLFSLQSPVGIKGYFAAPGLKVITPQLLTRMGAGAALGAAVNPFAALIAFVDPGDAQSAACGPVLAGARASAQRTVKGKVRKDVGPVKK